MLAIMSVNGRLVTFPEPEKAILHMGEVYRKAFTLLALEDLVVRIYIRNNKMPLENTSGLAENVVIDSLKAGLLAFGLTDIETEIERALKQFNELSLVEKTKRLIPYFQFGV